MPLCLWESVLRTSLSVRFQDFSSCGWCCHVCKYASARLTSRDCFVVKMTAAGFHCIIRTLTGVGGVGDYTSLNLINIRSLLWALRPPAPPPLALLPFKGPYDCAVLLQRMTLAGNRLPTTTVDDINPALPSGP